MRVEEAKALGRAMQVPRVHLKRMDRAGPVGVNILPEVMTWAVDKLG
jgi:hypothetical protein